MTTTKPMVLVHADAALIEPENFVSRMMIEIGRHVGHWISLRRNHPTNYMVAGPETTYIRNDRGDRIEVRSIKTPGRSDKLEFTVTTDERAGLFLALPKIAGLNATSNVRHSPDLSAIIFLYKI